MHNKFSKLYYFIDKFEPDILKNLDNKVTIIYRNYLEKCNIDLIKKIKHFCKKNNRKFFISNNFRLALYLDLDGVYIPSFNKEIKINSYKYKKKFKIIGSAHNIKEIRIKEIQGVQELFISPIFQTKQKKYLGINKFKILSSYTNINKIALGGIDYKYFNKLNLLDIVGVAGISMFKKKAP